MLDRILEDHSEMRGADEALTRAKKIGDG